MEETPAVPPPAKPLGQSAHEREVELRAQIDTNQYNYALRNLEMTAQDQREWRDHHLKIQKLGLIGWIVTLIAFLCFCGLAFLYNQAGIIAEVLRTILAMLGGGGIGYTIGARRGQQGQRQPVPPPQQ
jgi:hypothetical protein